MDEKSTLRVIRKKFRPGGRAKTLPLPLRKNGDRVRLAELFCDLEYNIGVEIGTHKGQYSEVLCSANPKLKLYCIDPWGEYLNMPHVMQNKQDELYQEAVTRLEPYNVEILRKKSMEALKDFVDRSLDFVYIDANHDFPFVYEDITEWAKKVKSGGIIACHDFYCIHWPGVKSGREIRLRKRC